MSKAKNVIRPERVNRRLYKQEVKLGWEETAELLEQLAERIRAGQITFGEGSEAVTTELPGWVTVELQLKDEGRRRVKRELELELEWEVDRKGNPVEKSGPSGISIG